MWCPPIRTIMTNKDIYMGHKQLWLIVQISNTVISSNLSNLQLLPSNFPLRKNEHSKGSMTACWFGWAEKVQGLYQSLQNSPYNTFCFTSPSEGRE